MTLLITILSVPLRNSHCVDFVLILFMNFLPSNVSSNILFNFWTLSKSCCIYYYVTCSYQASCFRIFFLLMNVDIVHSFFVLYSISLYVYTNSLSSWFWQLAHFQFLVFSGCYYVHFMNIFRHAYSLVDKYKSFSTIYT